MSEPTTLEEAISTRNMARLKQMLASGEHHPDGEKRDGSPLMTATWNADLQAIDILMRHGASPTPAESGDRSLCSPLHYASFRNLEDVALCLLSWGADPQFKNKEGESPLDVINGRVRDGQGSGTVRQCFAHPLHKAAAFGMTEACLRLLEQGHDPQAKNPRRQTALRCAQTGGHNETARAMQAWLARAQADAVLQELGIQHSTI